MVGHLGVDSMSAVGIATTLTMVIRITMVSVTSGAFTLVAQAVGARNPDHASSTAKQALTLVALISVGFGLVGMAISAPALHFFSPTDSVARLGVPYLLVFFAGLVFLGLNYAIHNCLYGAGDTRTPLYLSLLTSAVKLLFSYGLIFGAWGLPALGIVGAVTGTIIGQITGLIVGLWVLYSGRFALILLPETSYRPNRDLARRILKIGVPAGLQGIFGGGLRGAGDTRSALNYTLISQWLVRLPVSYVLAFTFGLDTNGLWISLVVFSVVQGILTVRRFAGGAWKSMRV